MWIVMLRYMILLGSLSSLLGQGPVLVELFTSEGCSSCPPADALLARLEKPEVIVLSEHVDYWNDLGWRDPFSSAQFSERQSGYARRLGTQGNYTPEMVVDGQVEFVGSDARRAAMAIEAASHRAKIGVQLSSVRRSAEEWVVHVEVAGVSEAASVMVALVEPTMVSHVARGENRGRELKHAGVVRSLREAGVVAKGGAFSKDVVLKTSGAGQRAVVFVQGKNQGAVLGTALVN